MAIDRDVLRVFMEHVKEAAPRWMKEIVHLGAKDVARLGPGAAAARKSAIKGAVRTSQRAPVSAGLREAATDLNPEQLVRHRHLAEKQHLSVLKSVGGKNAYLGEGMGPGFHPTEGIHVPADSGIFLREAMGGRAGNEKAMYRTFGKEMREMVPETPYRARPQDSSVTRSILHHEMGEAAAHRGAGQIGHIALPASPVSSHLGAGPLVSETEVLTRDPQAASFMQKVRTKSKDDSVIAKKMREFGHTANRPMPYGGKAHRKLDLATAAYSPSARSAQIQRAQLPGANPSPAMVQKIERLAAIHAAEPTPPGLDAFRGKVQNAAEKMKAVREYPEMHRDQLLGHMSAVRRNFAG